MASSQVSMQDVEEVVIVTIPDDIPSMVEEELTPQPGEEVLAVAPMEAQTEASSKDSLSKEEAVIVKLTEEVDVEADVFYPITCGDAKATLVWKRFACPGINIKCVQFNEQLISPKEFVCLAGKSTLKDWKRAIRLNGTMLRKIMDSGELDFYQHTQVCSNTCRSTKIDLVGSKASLSSESAELIPVTALSAELNGSAASFPDVEEESSEWVTAIAEDSVAFWHGMKEAGLLEEVVDDFQKELQEVLMGMQERVSEPPLQVKDAVLLNDIVQNFGMLDLVKKVLASHKNQMDRYREQYTRSLAALEQQCDEHRKRAKELKSKSQHLNNVLMNLTPAPAAPIHKRPRLTRATSGPASVNAAPTQITLPLNQLSGLPLGKVLNVAGANLGGYTLLTSPVTGPGLATDASNLTVLSTAAVQERTDGDGAPAPAAFIKVVGSQYQLMTLPGQATKQSTMVPLPVGDISVVGTLATTAVGTQEEGQAEADTDLQVEGQPAQTEEEEEEEPAEQQ